MADNKKYYWLKLKEDFFLQPRIKKLRRIAGGDTYTLIYLKLQLLSLKNAGVLVFEGIEDDFIEELALTIDEEFDNVQFTVMYLINQGLMEELKPDEFAMIETMQNIGSESSSTIRSRKSREKKKALQCNTDATPLQQLATKCNTEIEIEKEIKKDLDSDKDINTYAQSDETIAHEQVPIITITLNDKSEYPIFQEKIDEWKELYPNVDIEQQLRSMKGWCNANPTKRKTKRGILRFINSWLAREQDKPAFQKNNNVGSYKQSNGSASYTLKNGVETNNPFIKMMDEAEEESLPF